MGQRRLPGPNSSLLRLLVSAGILIGVGANAVLAQNNAPSYMVAEINVKDQATYEASGVVQLREHKAVTSANFPFSTRAFGDLAFGKEGKPSVVPGIANFPGIVTFAGGLPFMTANKVQIGGIGVSGGTSDQDEQCAQAGVDAVKGELM